MYNQRMRRVTTNRRFYDKDSSTLIVDGKKVLKNFRGKTVVVATGLFVENLPPLQGSELIWS